MIRARNWRSSHICSTRVLRDLILIRARNPPLCTSFLALGVLRDLILIRARNGNAANCAVVHVLRDLILIRARNLEMELAGRSCFKRPDFDKG